MRFLSGVVSFAASVLSGTGRSGLLVSPLVVLLLRLAVGRGGLDGPKSDGLSFALIEFLAALVSIGLAAHLIAHEEHPGRTEFWEFLQGSRLSWWFGKLLGVWICLGLCLFTVWPAFELAWILDGRSGSEPVHRVTLCPQDLRGLSIDGATAGLGAASLAFPDRKHNSNRPISLSPKESWRWQLSQPVEALWLNATALSPSSQSRTLEAPESFTLEVELLCAALRHHETLHLKPHVPFLLPLPDAFRSRDEALSVRIANPSDLHSLSLHGFNQPHSPLSMRALESLQEAGDLRQSLIRALLFLWIELLPFTALAALLALALSPESVSVLVLAACIGLGQPLFDSVAPIGLSGAGSLILHHRVAPPHESLTKRQDAALASSLIIAVIASLALVRRRP